MLGYYVVIILVKPFAYRDFVLLEVDHNIEAKFNFKYWRKNFSKKGATVKNQIALSGEDTKDFIAIIGNELAKEKKLIEYCKQNIDQRIKIVIKLPQFGARTSKATLINLPQKNNDGSEKVDLTKGNTKEDPIVLE